MKGLTQWLTMRGDMGECPRWYRVLKAAEKLNTTPWELETQPWRYVLQVEAAEAAEATAAKAHAKRST